MKKVITLFAVLMIGVYSISFSSNSHGWSGERQRSALRDWSLTMNLGTTSYFGDLSKYDQNLFKKFKHESKTSLSFTALKYFGNTFSVGGQILFGGLKNEANTEVEFQTDFVEYNLQARINLVELLNGDRTSSVGFNLYAGIGQFLFRSVEYTYVEGQQLESIHNTGIPEFVYFVGSNLKYDISDRFGVSLDIAVRQAQNDKLDNFSMGNSFDYYTFSSIGIIYRFKTLFGPSKTSNLTRNNFPYGKR